MNSRKKHGFTLIELLVVIAIIAILASILFPVFARARETARRASCLSNMKQIGLGIMQYVQDYDEKYPLSGAWDGSQGWPGRIEPYLKSTQILICPSDDANCVISGCGSWHGPGISYAANGYRVNDHSGSDDWTFRGIIVGYNAGWGTPTSKSMAEIPRAADTILLGEKASSDWKKAPWSWLDVISPYDIMNNLFQSDSNSNDGPWDADTGYAGFVPNGARPDAAYPVGKNGGAGALHNQTGNFLFADGHAKAMMPVRTNPDGRNRPQDNMWDATR